MPSHRAVQDGNLISSRDPNDRLALHRASTAAQLTSYTAQACQVSLAK
jgi:hypothetical protein